MHTAILRGLSGVLLMLVVFTVGAQGTDYTLTGVVPVTDYGIPFHMTLSPDGTLLAWSDPDEGMCLHRFNDETTTCTPFPNRDLRDHTALRWSPDSSLIAFTENWLVAFAESDLWLYEVETGTLTNRTDDDATGSAVTLRQREQSFALDAAPAWDPATGDLYFVRYTPTTGLRDYTAALHRIPRLGDSVLGVIDTTDAGLAESDPLDVLPLTPEVFTRLSVYHGGDYVLDGGMSINPDGTRLLLVARPATFADTGVWEVDLTDNTLTQLIQGADFDDLLRGVGFDGESLLFAVGRVESTLYRDGEPLMSAPLLDAVTFPGGILTLDTTGTLSLLNGDSVQTLAQRPDDDAIIPELNHPSAGTDGDTLRVLMGGYLFTFAVDDE